MNAPSVVDSKRVFLDTPQQTWQRALGQLRQLVPQATFNSLFADTSGDGDQDGNLVVSVPTPQAKAWIEARLAPPVHDALRAAGYTGDVSFQLRPDLRPDMPDHGFASPLPTPGPADLKPGDVALTFLNFNLYARGWLRTPSYYELFWQPILGHVAYAYWRLMQVLYWSNPSANFTRWVRLDIQDGAAHLGVSRDLVRGKPAQGLGGALQTLSEQGVAEVERHAAGRASLYTARFRRTLPILSADQVAQLTQSQQQQHLDWLLAAGYDLTAWQALSQEYPTFALPTGWEETGPAELIHYVNPTWETEPLSQTGFLRTPAYYDLFLQPLIGPVAYAIWRVCKCLNWTDASQTYTQDTVTSVYALAATLNCHRQKITGVKRRSDGIAYWQDGAFDRLRQERMALIREEGEGSQVAYRMLVVNEPPLLCPNQVDKLPEKLRLSHRDWLDKAQLQLDDWQQLAMDSLLTLVT